MSDSPSETTPAGVFSGRAAAAYDAGRAPYVAEVVAALGLPAAPATVVDLGAGTGLLSRALRTAGHAVIAVEPNADMRARLPGGVEVRATAAEATGLADGVADAVVAGDSWHWFDGADAAEEAHRVLGPGGRLAVVWRIVEPTVETEALSDLIARALKTAAPRLDRDRGREAIAAHPGFAPLERLTVAFTRVATRESLLAETASISYVNTHPDRDALMAQAQRAVAGLAGEVVRPMRAEVWRTVRLGG